MLTGAVIAHRYHVQAKVRAPPNGDVYLAEDCLVGDTVQVKTVERDAPPEGGGKMPRASRLAYLRQEVEALTPIRSEHVQRLLRVDVDTQIGPVLVFGSSEGEALLDDLRRAGPMPAGDLHPLIEQVWLGLAAVTRPASSIAISSPRTCSSRGAATARRGWRSSASTSPSAGRRRRHADGAEPRELLLRAPEQIGKAKTADHRADIYACATLIYQALSGQLPYAARNLLVMVEMKCKTDARRLSEAVPVPVDPRLEVFLARGLARDPRERFASAADALAAWRALDPTAPRRS